VDPVLSYLVENYRYIVVLLVTLFFWDLMDLYVELRNFRFIYTFTFAAYYFLRAFFCLALMEVGFIVELFTAKSRMVMAFVVPLGFSAILQNLVVKVGGVERSINIGEVFDKFKFRIKEDLISRDVVKKVLRQRQLLDASGVSNETILETCRFYAKDEAEYRGLVERTVDMDEEGRRIEYIVWLVDKAGTVDIAGELIKDAGEKSSAV
jgi:hypothetical protein